MKHGYMRKAEEWSFHMLNESGVESIASQLVSQRSKEIELCMNRLSDITGQKGEDIAKACERITYNDGSERILFNGKSLVFFEKIVCNGNIVTQTFSKWT